MLIKDFPVEITMLVMSFLPAADVINCRTAHRSFVVHNRKEVRSICARKWLGDHGIRAVIECQNAGVFEWLQDRLTGTELRSFNGEYLSRTCQVAVMDKFQSPIGAPNLIEACKLNDLAAYRYMRSNRGLFRTNMVFQRSLSSGLQHLIDLLVCDDASTTLFEEIVRDVQLVRTNSVVTSLQRPSLAYHLLNDDNIGKIRDVDHLLHLMFHECRPPLHMFCYVLERILPLVDRSSVYALEYVECADQALVLIDNSFPVSWDALLLPRDLLPLLAIHYFDGPGDRRIAVLLTAYLVGGERRHVETLIGIYGDLKTTHRDLLLKHGHVDVIDINTLNW